MEECLVNYENERAMIVITFKERNIYVLNEYMHSPQLVNLEEIQKYIERIINPDRNMDIKVNFSDSAKKFLQDVIIRRNWLDFD